MDQLVNVVLTIDKAHIVLERALYCGPGLDGMRQPKEFSESDNFFWLDTGEHIFLSESIFS